LCPPKSKSIAQSNIYLSFLAPLLRVRLNLGSMFHLPVVWFIAGRYKLCCIAQNMTAMASIAPGRTQRLTCQWISWILYSYGGACFTKNNREMALVPATSPNGLKVPMKYYGMLHPLVLVPHRFKQFSIYTYNLNSLRMWWPVIWIGIN